MPTGLGGAAASSATSHEPLGGVADYITRHTAGLRECAGMTLEDWPSGLASEVDDHPEARGRGAATVAVQLITRWAFKELGVQRLELTTAPENVASHRVVERAGFIREGVLRGLVATKNNGRQDTVMFSLLPADLG